MSLVGAVAVILAAAIFSQWIAWRLRIPAIIVLLATGLLAGPIMGWVDVDALFGNILEPVIGIAVAVILFEGGLGLRWSDIRAHGPVVARLVTIGVAITGAVGTAAAVLILGLPWDIALVLGMVLTVSGPTVVLPLLHHVRAERHTAAVLRWEGILVDPVGAVLAVLAFEVLVAGGFASGVDTALAIMARALLAGVLIGLATGALVTVLEARFLVPDVLAAGVGLASVVGAYALANAIQAESGLVAVTVMGIVLANQRFADVRHILEFKENLSQILLGVLFVLLAAAVSRSELLALDGRAFLFVAALVLVARPLAVAVSTAGSRLTWPQRGFLAWMAPRGIVAAAVSAFFALRLEAHGRPEAAILVPVTFLTIVLTVALYGLTARPVARLLGVAGPPPNGVLVVGANAVARALVRPLEEAGIPYMMVDRNVDAVMAANTEGRRAVHSDALDPQFTQRIGIEGMGMLWALTPNRTTNALAAVRFADDFGRANVYQIRVEGGGNGDMAAHLRGRTLWGEEATYALLRRRLRNGWRVAKTPLTASFSLEDWLQEHGPEAIPLFKMDEDEQITMFTEPLRHIDPPALLVGLVPPKD